MYLKCVQPLYYLTYFYIYGIDSVRQDSFALPSKQNSVRQNSFALLILLQEMCSFL